MPTWSRLSDGSPIPHGPGAPARIFVHADLDQVWCSIVECDVTSRADTALPVTDGHSDRIDLTSNELDWLIASLQEARDVLRAEAIAQGACVHCGEQVPGVPEACPDRDDPGGPCERGEGVVTP